MRTAAAMTVTPPVAPAPAPRRVDDDDDARVYVARHDHDRDDLSSPSTLSSVFDDNYTRHNISGALDDAVMLDSDDASMFPSWTWRSMVEMELYRYALDNDSRLGDGGRSGSAAWAGKMEVEEGEEGEDEAAAAAANVAWVEEQGDGEAGPVLWWGCTSCTAVGFS